MDEFRGAGGASAPPSRDTGSRGGAWRTVNTPMGPLQITDKPGGGHRIKFTSQSQLDNANEAAAFSGGMSLNEYVQHQIDEALQVSRGERGTLQIGEGKTHG